ncbi:hypothetical protein LTR56_021690 [Elasticomyces elasticus]|nr:hypothetical protein LTR56_021690 [Elasticomyces elasticus]KAK3664847.1 hypothetical protein LTR22_004437 [Elasticomyces elasticus]KAK4928656.1 hypothetical protein LTR49_004779 [Elasticomyces elasticus]KAK5765226.1 hypothetical protein LTS12_004740 [Elasticomyces elasticus]
MPARPIVRKSLLDTVNTESYTCPSCFIRAAIRTNFSTRAAHCIGQTRRAERRNGELEHRSTNVQLNGPQISRPRRQYSSQGSLASTTAINAPTTVPPRYRELHQQLLALQEEANTYVNLSRLQLAARSLESEQPITRVALLGLGQNGANAARKLARALLSDPLGEEQAWEQDLLQSVKDGRSLLLRYGDSEDTAQASPLVQTLHVPSPFLRRHNVEILVTSLNPASADRITDAELEEAILVPSLTTPSSAGGRVGFVRYPVHKALVVAEGITGAVSYGRLPRFIDKAELITAALSLPLRSSSAKTSAEEETTDNVVDIDLATHALDLFRASNANGAQFSNEWQTSRLSALSKWIAGAEAREEELRPAVRSLLDSVLLNASASIEGAESEQSTVVANSTIPEANRSKLDALISHFSADWHRDLQDNLGAGLQSRSWRRTAWWRLIWRIDDVSVSAADILRLSWLTEAEQTMAFISGRIEEAGLATSDELREAGPASRYAIEGADHIEYTLSSWEPKRAAIIAPPKEMYAAELLQQDVLVARVKEESGINAAFNPPWPRTIHLARQQMLHTLVPAFHRRAQTLLLSTLSTAGGASALGAWIYLATAGSAVQGAGALAALGIVWSLRRLQTLWGKERDDFAITVKENGRRVLAEVERHLRRLVKEGGRASIRPEDTQGWQQARAAVQNCRKVLEKAR